MNLIKFVGIILKVVWILYVFMYVCIKQCIQIYILAVIYINFNISCPIHNYTTVDMNVALSYLLDICLYL